MIDDRPFLSTSFNMQTSLTLILLLVYNLFLCCALGVQHLCVFARSDIMVFIASSNMKSGTRSGSSQPAVQYPAFTKKRPADVPSSASSTAAPSSMAAATAAAAAAAATSSSSSQSTSQSTSAANPAPPAADPAVSGNGVPSAGNTAGGAVAPAAADAGNGGACVVTEHTLWIRSPAADKRDDLLGQLHTALGDSATLAKLGEAGFCVAAFGEAADDSLIAFLITPFVQRISMPLLAWVEMVKLHLFGVLPDACKALPWCSAAGGQDGVLAPERTFLRLKLIADERLRKALEASSTSLLQLISQHQQKIALVVTQLAQMLPTLKDAKGRCISSATLAPWYKSSDKTTAEVMCTLVLHGAIFDPVVSDDCNRLLPLLNILNVQKFVNCSHLAALEGHLLFCAFPAPPNAQILRVYQAAAHQLTASSAKAKILETLGRPSTDICWVVQQRSAQGFGVLGELAFVIFFKDYPQMPRQLATLGGRESLNVAGFNWKWITGQLHGQLNKATKDIRKNY